MYGGFSAEPVIAELHGVSVRGILTIPRHVDKPAPGILMIHGGPGLSGDSREPDRRPSMATPAGMMDVKLVRKYLCRRYPVLFADFVSDFPGDPSAFPWIFEFYRILRDHPAVHSERICLMGPSHGGYLSLRCASDEGRHVNPCCVVAFSAFVDVALLLRFWGLQVSRGINIGPLTRAGLEKARDQLGWPRRRDRATLENYRYLSVLERAGNLDMPLLLIHGLSDEIVPSHHSALLLERVNRCQGKAMLLSPGGEKMGGHFLFGLNESPWIYVDSFFKEKFFPA